MKYFTFFERHTTGIVFKLADIININIYDILSFLSDTQSGFFVLLS